MSDDDPVKSALYELALAMNLSSIEGLPDDVLGRLLVAYQEEYERRHPEEGHWTLEAKTRSSEDGPPEGPP